MMDYEETIGHAYLALMAYLTVLIGIPFLLTISTMIIRAWS